MKERSILYTAPMVQAVLDDIKTKTRRIMKPQPSDVINKLFIWKDNATTEEEMVGLCPYGQPGDRLYVKETFYAFGRWETRFNDRKGRDEWHFIDMTLDTGRQYLFSMPSDFDPGKRSCITPTYWKRPSIFMPRVASRITLEITGVGVERLQDISEADALAEGIIKLNDGYALTERGEHYHTTDPRRSFASLWTYINGSDSWEMNPWVWVIEFKRVEP